MTAPEDHLQHEGASAFLLEEGVSCIRAWPEDQHDATARKQSPAKPGQAERTSKQSGRVPARSEGRLGQVMRDIGEHDHLALCAVAAKT